MAAGPPWALALSALALLIALSGTRPAAASPAVLLQSDAPAASSSSSPAATLSSGASERAEPCERSPTATDTTRRLAKIRELMAAHNVAAYIVPSDDEHGSEYTAEADHRRQWLSGFTGSLGDLVVTRDAALLWTDSRYWVQGAREMDCSWTLMRKGHAGVPSIEKWLLDNVAPTDVVGADPRMVSYSLWSTWSNYLSTHSGASLRAIEANLVDEAWGADKPDYPDTPITPLAARYTGELWQSKVARVRDAMRAAGHDLLVLSALDDCAWLLNLRSGEVPYTPVFRCYVVLGVDDTGAVSMDVFLPTSKVTQMVRDHLCDPDLTTRIHDHQAIWTELPTIAAAHTNVALTMPVVYHTGASYKLFTAVRGESSRNRKVQFIASPVLYMKATKNAVEAMGMKRAHVKDAVALIEMMSILAEEVPAGKYWDEQMVVEALDKLRWQQENSRGPSFDTIAAFGVNAALPHYQPSNQTNLRITTDGLFMVDSGGQFSEGTTDVTRTMHYGTPRPLQQEVYTRLLKGCIDLASTKFPAGQTMQNLEVLLRRPLFQLGLQYGHGSTHGIGHFLTVHESFDYVYKENFFGSQEPGYYLEGDFGMRLENIVQVVPAEVMYKSETKFLTFETTTLVPYERKLIKTEMLTEEELKWLNLYNQRIRISIGPELLRQNKQKVYKWLLEQTQPYY